MSELLTDGETVDTTAVDDVIDEVRRHHSDVDADTIRRAYAFAEEHHRGQLRRSGEPFISHPVGCAMICAELGADSQAIQAALMHDTVEDTEASLDEVEALFGSDVAALVDGVTKLTKIHFESQEEHQAENYRKLIVSMSSDLRVLVVKLADRLHNMRTLSYMSKNKRIQKARETLEIYAPLAHRLGIHALKSELEDLAFAALHPRRYAEIQQLVNQRRADRDAMIADAGAFLDRELQDVGIVPIEITGRAKHIYSIYEKMTVKSKEFNEIYDLTALRVIVDSVKDCYGAVGIIHSLWKPMPGRFKDYIAMPKFNGYQSLHTTVIGTSGHPLEIQIRTPEMHRIAEFGVAAHWLYKDQPSGQNSPAWVGHMMEWQEDTSDPGEFMDSLRSDLYQDAVYVFTPKGEVRELPAGATPIDFAYAVHTDVGHRTVGARVNGRIVPLSHGLRSGDFVEILTSKAPRGPSRDWLHLVSTSKARSKIRAFFRREQRDDAEHQGRDLLHEHLRKAGLPNQKIAGSPLLHQVIQEMGFRKAEEFYISIGSGRTSVQTVVNKIIARLKAGEGVDAQKHPAADLEQRSRLRSRSAQPSTDLGLSVDGVPDVLVRLASCCKPVPGDEILGYISLGRGITVHREDCPNARALLKNPERFTTISWVGPSQRSFNVEIAIDGWDRPRLLEDLSRTVSEAGANIIVAQCTVEDQMARARFTVDLGDVEELRSLISGLRNVEGVFDAYRVTPGI